MDLERTQTFEKIADIVNAGENKNPFGLTEVEDRFVRRSMPAFLNSLVKYSSDLSYNSIDFRKYGSCFEIPYDERNCRDSYVWRVNAFLAGEDTVFTRSCNSREEMIDLRTELFAKDAQVSGNLLETVDEVSQTFYDIIVDFYRSSTNVKYRAVNADYVKGLINRDRLPETGLSKSQTLYCCKILEDSMNEVQNNRAKLEADLEREQSEMGN